MLKQPRPEDVGRDLGKYPPFLLILFARRIVVLFPGALAAANTRVASVACEQKRKRRNKLLEKFSNFLDPRINLIS